MAMLVHEVANAEEAIAAAETEAYDIALCDASVAGRDGVWLAWRLRERRPNTAIIVATAIRDCETAVSRLRNDVVDYLLKPFDRERLYEALSLARDWHAAAAGAVELHLALQDRLRNRRARLAATLAEAQTTHLAALDGLISMLQLHERDGRGHATRVARLTLTLADVTRPLQRRRAARHRTWRSAARHRQARRAFSHPHEVGAAR